MKELALVLAIISGLALAAGLLEVKRPAASKCWGPICVGRDEATW